MTLVGLGGPLVPGTRLGIRVCFPVFADDENNNEEGIIPCHRVCCALVGEEYAIFEGAPTPATGGVNLPKSKKRVKTRSYVFDSSYELVEFGYTEAISMSLILPLDCPVTVKTDLVEVTVMLKVEFTVSRASIDQSRDEAVQDIDRGEFSVIRLDLPCEVNNHGTSMGGGEEDACVPESSIRKLQQFWKSDKITAVGSFDDSGIQKDLRLLSLQMMKSLTPN